MPGVRSTNGDGASSMIFWWRRWIEHSRSPTAHTVPWVSAEHLDLDMVSGGQVALAEHGRVAERGLRLALSRGDFAGQGRQLANHPHAAAAAARRRLDQHRQLGLR